ncbi:MAG TPA: hypothetical protein PKD86_05970 [Gemmatales bacterium]|nr:hypothetical protein [Gemmatales bacterium]HMP58881.1 hypothetical protein [Gemmatales bacterium]
MRAWARRIGLLALALGGVAMAGCNPFGVFTLAAYLTGVDREQKVAFRFPNDAQRVMVITVLPPSSPLDLGNLDREINENLSRRISLYFDSKNRRFKKEVILPRKLHEFQGQNPDWQRMDVGDIARVLKADHVVVINLRMFRLYEPGSSNSLYKGHAEGTLTVFRVTPEDCEPVMPEEAIVVDFPNADRPVPTTDVSLPRFRQAFINHFSERISWYFVPHETADEFARSTF